MGMLGGLGRGGREGELVSHINLQKTCTAVSTGFNNFKRRGKNLSTDQTASEQGPCAGLTRERARGV